MFAVLLPLILTLAPQLAGMIFGSNGAEATAKVAGVVQAVVGDAADLSVPGGAAAAVAHLQSNAQASADLTVKLADLHLQMQKQQDDETETSRKDMLDELKLRLSDASSAREMATELARSRSSLAYGGVIVSVVIVAAFGWTTYSVLNNHLSAADGQFGAILVGTLAAMATQVANYWLGSSVGSASKDALLANAQDTLATSIPGSMVQSRLK